MAKKLYRSNKDRMLAGVCGGLGDYLDIDPTFIRIVWALLFFTGVGFVAYLVAWLVIPTRSNIY